ncbi:efflux RND transporter permease subunit [Paraglaciecola sp. Hal342]
MSAFDMVDFIQPTLDEMDWSGGYSYEFDGEIEESKDINGKLAAGMIPGVIIMFAAIMFQFNSMRRVTLIFLTIPLILIGSPIALLATGQPLSFFATLGLISLAGIIINNAIVLIDQIDIESQSLALKEAIIVAAKKRITPISLTTLTTVVGLLPMAIAGGALFEPMATLMIGGLLLASAISLFFVPSAFYLFFKGNKELNVENGSEASKNEGMAGHAWLSS